MKIFDLFCLISALFFFICGISIATPVPISKPQNELLASQSQQSNELDQKNLFDMTRRGVVAITVKAHLILDKYINQKLWYGTGFIVDTEHGIIVTNAHVAGEMSVCTYEVKFGDGKSAEARLEYIDPCYDFAVLSVNKKDLPQYTRALKISNTPLSINTEIYSMGNSSNNEFSTYKGYVFDTESILWLKPIAEQSFQFSGLTVPGASGSPVLNKKGEVVGILYGGKLISGAALPISYIKPVIDSIKDKKKFHRYFYGFILNYASLQDAISAENIPESLIEEYEKEFPNSNNKVLYVSKKLSAFGADNSELKSGDIIWKVDGELIGARLKRIDEIVQEKAGKPILLTIYRNGEKKEIETPTFEMSTSSKMKLLSFAGTTFFETTPELKINLGKNNSGVYISDSEAGSAFMDISSPSNDGCPIGGAQIVSIDGKKVSSIDDVADIIPSLFKKKVFNVKFIKLGVDPQECSITTKYSPEFAEATMYTFNQSDKKWDVRAIKNPKQE
mgnify:CR=1 FL=1